MTGQGTRTLKNLVALFLAFFFTQAAQAQCGGIQAPPVEESFDNSTMPPGCWENVALDGTDVWETGQQGDAGFSAGDASEHTGNGGYYAFVDFSDVDTAALVSDTVDVSGMTNNPQAVYWYYSNNTNNPSENNTLELQAWDGSAWQTVATHIQNDPDWQRNSADLSAYVFNDSVKVRFVGMVNDAITAYYDDILIDDIQIRETPSCPKPLSLTTNALSSDSIEISWTSNASGTEWEVHYDTAGFTPGTGDTVTSLQTTDTITGLMANTDYDFYVREVCGSGDTSAWSGPIQGKTLCPNNFAAPFYEDFNDAPFSSGDGDTGVISDCWNRSPEVDGEYSWRPNDGATGSGSTGPDDDHPGGGNYMYTEGSDVGFGELDTAYLSTPYIDLSGVTLPQFRFYYHFYGVEMDTFFVQMDTGNGWGNLDTIVGQVQTASSDPYQAYNDFLKGIGGDTARFRFIATGRSFESDYAIDSVSVTEGPSCPWPSDLSANALNEDSVELSWTSYGSGSEWEVWYTPQGTSDGDTVLLSDNPDTLTGLSGNNVTAYDFYVREVCGASDTSKWSDEKGSFVTPCPGTFTAPFSEDMSSSAWTAGTGGDNTGDAISSCWTRNPGNTGTDFFWGTRQGATSSFGTGPDGDHPTGSGKYIYTEGNNGSAGDTADIMTPWVDLTAFNLPQLRFFYHFNGADIDSFLVAIDDGSGWQGVDTIVGEDQTDETDPWKVKNNILPDQIDDTVRVRFRAYRGGGNSSDYALDSIRFMEGGPCPTPTGLTANAISGDSVELSWSTIGIGSQWQVEYGPDGFTQGSGDTVMLNSNPDTITGLAQSSNRNYDFYIRELCGGGDTSSWSNAASATTPCLTVFPSPVLEEFNNDPWIAGSGFDNSGDQISSCWSRDPIDQGSDYAWGTRSGQTSSSYNGPNGDYPSGSGNYIYTEGSNGSGGDTARITTPWIDLGSLSTPQLRFFYHFNTSSNSGGTSQDFGKFWVSVNDGSGWTPIDSILEAKQSDEADPWKAWSKNLYDHKDDTVQFRFVSISGGTYSDVALDNFELRENPNPRNIGMVSLDSLPNNGCKSLYDPEIDFKVNFENVGSVSEDTLPYAYSIDGAAPVEDTVFTTVQPGNTATATIGPTSGFAGQGQHDLEVYTTLSQDTVFSNDTLRETVLNGGGSNMTPSSSDKRPVQAGDYVLEDSLFICGSQYDVYDCARIFTLTIDSIAHEDALDELDIQLVSPEGTTLDLWMQLGGGSDRIMDDLTFTDTASTNITAATPSGGTYSGPYHPEEAAGFAKFQGERINGMWRLRIFNDDFSDTASFHGWNMRAIDPNKPQPDLGPDTAICQEQDLLLDPGQDPDWSYRWDNNSTESTRPVAGSFLDTNNTYSYHVTVKDEAILNQCSNSDTIEVTVENCTGIEDREGDSDISFKVHPNPAKDRLNIRSEGADDENFRYELMDLQGRTLKSLNAEDGQRRMNVSQLSKGVYILKGYRSSGDRPLFQKKVVIR